MTGLTRDLLPVAILLAGLLGGLAWGPLSRRLLGPRAVFRRFAEGQGWEPVEASDKRGQVFASERYKVVISCWETSGGPVFGKPWEVRADFVLPARFLTRYADAVVAGAGFGARAPRVDSEGSLRITGQGRLSEAALQQLVERLTGYARALDGGCADPDAAVLHLLRKPASPELGVAALAWCLEHHPLGALSAELLAESLRSSTVAVRAAAARRVDSDAARDVLLDIVRDGAVPDRTRLEALDALCEHPRFGSAVTNALDRYLDRAHGRTFAKLLEVLQQRLDHAVSTGRLWACWATLGVEARQAIVRTVAPRRDAEELLLEALEDDDATVRMAAAEALGDHGASHWIGALRELRVRCETSDHKRRVGSAIAAIERRHPNAARTSGGLMVADATAAEGQLSEADGEGGLFIDA